MSNLSPGPTLAELWRQYRDKIYPQNMPAEQNRECHQAFMAGAFVALTEMTKAVQTDSPGAEEAYADHLTALLREATDWHRLRSTALNTGRN
jgi:hypothetical protein